MIQKLNGMTYGGRVLRAHEHDPAKAFAGSRKKQQQHIAEITESGRRIHIRNLPSRVDPAQLNQYYSQFGTVMDVHVPVQDGRPRGFAFVTMSNTLETDTAIKATNGRSFMGQTLRAHMALPRGQTR